MSEETNNPRVVKRLAIVAIIISLIALAVGGYVATGEGSQGPMGPQGPASTAFAHEWNDTSLRIKNSNGTWGEFVDLLGPQGPTGNTGDTGPEGPPASGFTGGGQAHDNMQPYLTVNFIICIQGAFPSRNGFLTASPFIGEIRMFAGNFAPGGWAFCDGQLLPVSQYNALFSILGVTYGGDGRTTFGLPDLRSRVPLHAGIGPDLSSRSLGEKNGSEVTLLTVDEMPSHNHGTD
jgi:microcystin-dependent protein